MFWTDEDIQPAFELTGKLFGPHNRYEHNINAYRNLTIMTRQYGKLWFGDLELNDHTRENLEKLSVTINQRVYLVKGLDWQDALYTTTSKLREFSSDEVTR
jgi:hypothetical protein|tara:strand:- start:4436 stop:4738 length:303 start_codon:yes stop_codon:yes gene_type:complete